MFLRTCWYYPLPIDGVLQLVEPPMLSPMKRQNFFMLFNLADCSNCRSCPAMVNIVSTKSKLCRANLRVPFHANELSVAMMAAIGDLFTPHGGSVLAPYSGSMSISIACMKTGRRCFSIEKNSNWFKAAVKSLCRFLLPVSSKRDLQQKLDWNLERHSPVQICSKNYTIVQNSPIRARRHWDPITYYWTYNVGDRASM